MFLVVYPIWVGSIRVHIGSGLIRFVSFRVRVYIESIRVRVSSDGGPSLSTFSSSTKSKGKLKDVIAGVLEEDPAQDHAQLGARSCRDLCVTLGAPPAHCLFLWCEFTSLKLSLIHI